MRSTLHRLPAVLSATVVLSLAYTMASADNDWDRMADARKADMMFLEAQSAYSDGEFDRYIYLLDKAYELNPNDLDIAGERALITLLNEATDSAGAERAYDDLKRRYFADPGNYITGSILANVASQRGMYDDAVRIWETLDSLYPKYNEPPQQLALAYLLSYIKGDTTAYDKAIGIYRRMSRGAGRSIEQTRQLVRAYMLKSDTTAIINELDSLYAEMPNDSYAACFIGANYEGLHMPQRAIQYYDRACQLDSTNGVAYLSRARFYMAQGDSAGFDREVFHALKSPNLDTDVKTEILRTYVADLYTDHSQEPRIRELFNTLQQTMSGEPSIHTLYGAYLYELDLYGEAAEQFGYAAYLDPSNEDTWQSCVQMYAMAQDTTNLEVVAAEAMHRFPTNLYFPGVLSTSYRIRDDNARALAVLDSVDLTVVKNNKGVSTLLTSKGDIDASMGDTVQALELYDQALEYNPDNSMALNNAAYFMTLTGGDLDKAERYSARSIQGDELNPTYLDTYAWVFFNKKDYKMAKHYIDIALNAYGPDEDDSIDVPEPPIDAIDDDGTTDPDAVEVIEGVDDPQYDQYEPPSSDVYDHAGDIYFMNGEITQALDFWKKALELEPDNALIEKKVKNKTIFFK